MDYFIIMFIIKMVIINQYYYAEVYACVSLCSDIIAQQKLPKSLIFFFACLTARTNTMLTLSVTQEHQKLLESKMKQFLRKLSEILNLL